MNRDGLQKPLTVISGPPGTGKSQVVASLMVSAAAAGKSVLFASHTHKAIDAVFSRVNGHYRSPLLPPIQRLLPAELIRHNLS